MSRQQADATSGTATTLSNIIYCTARGFSASGATGSQQPDPAVSQLRALLAGPPAVCPNSDSQRSRQRHQGSPLHVVAQLGGAASCAVLLRAHAAVSALDALGRTPLHLAAQRGTAQLVELLIKAVRPRSTSPAQPPLTLTHACCMSCVRRRAPASIRGTTAGTHLCTWLLVPARSEH